MKAKINQMMKAMLAIVFAVVTAFGLQIGNAFAISGELVGKGDSVSFKGASSPTETLIILKELTDDSVEVHISQPKGFPGECKTTKSLDPSHLRDTYTCDADGNTVTLTLSKGQSSSVVDYETE